MRETGASKTALGVTAARVAHLWFDGPPPVLDDPIAAQLFSDAGLARIRAAEGRFREPASRALRSHILLRSRYAEERLEAAAARGVDQYVLLGAGFDTFAWRQPAWAGRLRIVEVDHPLTQHDKLRRLEASGLDAPANLVFAPADFERESLSEVLSRHVSVLRPAFFSCLGVLMYLDSGSARALFETTAAFPPGSELVATYRTPRDGESAVSGRLAEVVEREGEPFVSSFTKEQMESALRAAGFTGVEFLAREEARERYYREREDGLPVPRDPHIVSARR